MIELTGIQPNDETVAAVLKQVKTFYANGKQESLKDSEFKKILQTFRLFPDKIPSESKYESLPELCLDVPA
jgi:isopropylmalate/homocitrate/citramalate synthase